MIHDMGGELLNVITRIDVNSIPYARVKVGEGRRVTVSRLEWIVM